MIENKNKKKILFVGGTLNSTTMMHKISKHLSQYDCYFSAMYTDGWMDRLVPTGVLDFVPLAVPIKKATEEYILDNGLKMDYKGEKHDYDLYLVSTDLIFPDNLKNKKVIHVQEGMTDPEDLRYYLAKYFKFPRWFASTSMMGLSDAYDYFCVASEGYKELFINKGVRPEKIKVTGIPNFDNYAQYYNNTFPYKHFVLCATSDLREVYKHENRRAFIKKAADIAEKHKKQLIFKLHPNENKRRAIREIKKYAPNAITFTACNAHEMIANADVLITRYSTVVYTGLALGKKVYCDVDIDELRKLTPKQNGGTSAKNIADLAIELLYSKHDKKIMELFKFQPFEPLRQVVNNRVLNKTKVRI